MLSEKDIRWLLIIMSTCDNGCNICVCNMYEMIKEHVPHLSELARKIFIKMLHYDCETSKDVEISDDQKNLLIDFRMWLQGYENYNFTKKEKTKMNEFLKSLLEGEENERVYA